LIRELTVCPATMRACQPARSCSSTIMKAQPWSSPTPIRPARPNICWTVPTSRVSRPTWVSWTTTARAGRFTPAATVEVATRTSAPRLAAITRVVRRTLRLLPQKTRTLPPSWVTRAVMADASRVRAASVTVKSGLAGMAGSCQLRRPGRQVMGRSVARSHPATCSALAMVADSPTILAGVPPSRTRASSASRTGPRAASPSMWISSTTSDPTSASASRKAEARQMASNFSVVATHRSAR